MLCHCSLQVPLVCLLCSAYSTYDAPHAVWLALGLAFAAASSRAAARHWPLLCLCLAATSTLQAAYTRQLVVVQLCMHQKEVAQGHVLFFSC